MKRCSGGAVEVGRRGRTAFHGSSAPTLHSLAPQRQRPRSGARRAKRCAFLTTDPEILGGFVTDDALAHAPFGELGWHVDEISWRRRDVDWNDYEAVVLRSSWDYQRDPERFFAVLETIERSRARLLNPLELVRWNLRKTYLFELAARGVPIVPSASGSNLDERSLGDLFDRFGSDELVVKPVIGANADDTFRIPRGAAGATGRALAAFSGRDYLAQPFVSTVLGEGEHSLFFFAGEHSHAIRKVPKSGDFRVQEEHGADILAVPAPRGLVELGERAVAAVAPSPLYARVDVLRLGEDEDRFGVIELELIEPSLYLRCHPDAPRRFARAFDAWMSGGRR
jgi:glutathione synthase/RimK-type ligase-like ATP-grasp enzyme